MRKIILTSIILSLLLFTSCEPNMDLSLKIQNNSTEKLIVEFKALHNSQLDSTLSMNIDALNTILNVSQRKKAKYYDCCPCEIEDLKIFTTDTTLVSIKDFKDKNNWMNVKDYKNQWNGKVNCILVINDEDLE